MSDMGFKLIYKNPDNMLTLINAILGENFASSATMLDKEVQTDRVLGKRSAFDMLCKTPKGEVIVEVQVKKDKNLSSRLIFYSSYIIQEQYAEYRRKKLEEERILQEIKEREKDSDWSGFKLYPVVEEEYIGGFAYEMHPMYVIAIMGFNMERNEEEDRPRNEDVIRSFQIRDNVTGELFSDKLNYTLVEIGRFNKQEKDLTSASDRLLYSFKNMAGQRSIPETFKNTDMAKIYDTAQLAALSDEEYRAYMQEVFAEEKRLSEWQTALEEERMAIAKKFLDMGLSVEEVSKGTGLSIDEVKSLKENLDQ